MNKWKGTIRKIIMTNNIIAPTNTQLFNELRKKFEKEWIEFIMVFNSETESIRKRNTSEEKKKFKFKYYILDWTNINNNDRWNQNYFHINKWFLDILKKENPDLLIHCWRAAFTVFQWLYRCKKNKKKFYLWSWSTEYEESWRRTITKPIIKFLVRHCDWYWSYWTRASEYLISLWAKKEKIYPLYNTVDVDFFLWESERLKPKKAELKEKYWIKTKNVLLFVGQLIERKWVYEILKWFKNFQRNNADLSLVFVWWWQEKENMEKIIKDEWIKNVYFPGFFQKDKISELYTIADIFTLPSIEEVRWLVINEAMCFWLPIITAYQVWASVDLVKEWKNGYVMKENTWKEFERALNFILEKDLIQNNESINIIKEFKVDKIVSWISI